MKNLVILGSGVHAAEMAEIVERINRQRKTWNLLGFISRNPADVGRKFNGKPVLGTFDHLTRWMREKVFFTASNCNKLPQAGFIDRKYLVSLVDPGAFVSKTAVLGKGCVVYPGCFIGLQAKLGDMVFMLANCIVNHDVVLEDRVIVTSGVALAGHVHVEENCYLGQACTVREGLRIGRGSLIGMGAVVVKDVPAGSVMTGNPAKKLRNQNTSKAPPK